MISFELTSKAFGTNQALDGLSFDVPQGCITALAGPNGSGKTTALRILLGLDKADSGTATFSGVSYRDLKSPLLQVGAALDGMDAHPSRSALNHLRAVAATHNLSRQRVDEVLSDVGLSSVANRRVGTFSLGMTKRLAIATAMLGRPKYVILDEPTNGLDIDGIKWLRAIVAELAATGSAVLIASHSLAEIENVATDIVILAKGRVITSGAIGTMLANDSVTVRSADNRALSHLLTEAGASAKLIGPTLEVTGATPEEIGFLASEHRLPLFEISNNKNSLAEFYERSVAEHTEFKAQQPKHFVGD